MGKLSKQAGSELKQLPLTLGKLLGGIMAVAGFGTAIWVDTRGAGSSQSVVTVALLAGVAGIVLFVLAGRKMAARALVTGTQLSKSDKRNTSILSWSLLLLFAAIFLLGVMFFLR